MRNTTHKETIAAVLEAFTLPPETDSSIGRLTERLLQEIGTTREKISREAFAEFLPKIPEQMMRQRRRTVEIAFDNDMLRRNVANPHPTLGKVALTESVFQSDHLPEILSTVATFDEFSQGNDPYQEHDFGSVTVGDEQYFFKIDYYDGSFEYGVDPYEEEPYRVITIMHSSEY